jgi:hypothetical protein
MRCLVGMLRQIGQIGTMDELEAADGRKDHEVQR